MGRTLSPKARAGRIGGLTTRSRHDPAQYTLPGRQAATSRFWEGIPETLPEPERLARFEAARRAHFARLSARRWNGHKPKAKSE